MEGKEKAVSSYVLIFLLTAAFLLLLRYWTNNVQRSEWNGYSIETQYETAELTAPRREKIDVNTASVQELETLTGIGPALALEIVKEREENGAFESFEDLLRVKGIGESTLESFRYEVKAGG